MFPAKYFEADDLPSELVSRFLRMRESSPRVGDCLLWQGSKDPNGYGKISHRRDGQSWHIGVHRLSLMLSIGRIPDGMVADHLCRVRSCIEPSHLRAVTDADNIRSGLAGEMKTHCPQGHALSGANLHIVHRSNGKSNRVCRICRGDAKRRYMARKASAA